MASLASQELKTAEGTEVEPKHFAEALEKEPVLPAGLDERFMGYGVMSCPFRSGHILCLRRFPASSIGPAIRLCGIELPMESGLSTRRLSRDNPAPVISAGH